MIGSRIKEMVELGEREREHVRVLWYISNNWVYTRIINLDRDIYTVCGLQQNTP